MPYSGINPLVAQFTFVFATRILGAFACIQGLNIILGGKDRWTGQGYAVALLLPGAPPSWGVILLATGLISIMGSVIKKNTVAMAGLYLSAIWSAFFSLSFAIASVEYPLAGTTGIWTYATLAFLYALFGVGHKESQKAR